MTGFIKKAVLGAALGASTLVAVAPAEAQYYRRHRDNGDAAAAAIVGGIVGLGVGAAIASSNRGGYYDRGYYNRGYYDDGYYNNYNNYNYNNYNYNYQPRRGYYNDYRNNYRQRCYIQQQYDRWSGQVYNVRVCQ